MTAPDPPAVAGVGADEFPAEWKSRCLPDMVNDHYATQHPGYRESVGGGR